MDVSIVQLNSTYLDQLGPWGKFVENSMKLTSLEISGYQIVYNTVLYLLNFRSGVVKRFIHRHTP